MTRLRLAGGIPAPSIGLGTWRMGESAGQRTREVAAIRTAIDLGYRVVDTAEMYGDGGAEEVVGLAISEALRTNAIRREEMFVVSKVYPHNADRKGTKAACERSLRRLGLDCIDLYLIHWPGSHPLQETVGAFESLQSRGLIRQWGVSNFDLEHMQALQRVAGGVACATNQIYYSLSQRAPEFDLLPWLRAEDVSVMAYSPIDQGTLARNAKLHVVSAQRGATAAQVALAWLMAKQSVMAIPKAVRVEHLTENIDATRIVLDDAELAALDEAFSPPVRASALAMR